MIKLKQLLTELLTEKMSREEAEQIFNKFGVKNVSSTPTDELTRIYKKLVKQHHPDIGGNTNDMKDINSAWDILKQSPEYVYTNQTKSTYRQQQNTNQQNSKENNPWAWAGHSGGSDPNTSFSDNEKNLNYVKKKAWEISGKPEAIKSNKYQFWNWDGNFFRGVFSVYAITNKLFEISQMMVNWDKCYKSKAVFFCKPNEKNKIYLINLDGKYINPPYEFIHDSFNNNPGNDAQFVHNLRNNLGK